MRLCLTWWNTSWRYIFVSYRMKYILKCGFVSYGIKSWGMGLCLTGSNTSWMWHGRLTTSSSGCSTTATSVSTTKRTLNWWNTGSKLTNLSTKQGEGAQNLQIYQQSEVREHKTYKFINKARWGNTKLINLSTKWGEGTQNLQIYPQSEVS